MKNRPLALPVSKRYQYKFSACQSFSVPIGVAWCSLGCLCMALLATNAWALTPAAEKQLIKRCDKINAKIKKTKLTSRSGGSSAKMEKLRLKVYALDDEYFEHKCILVRSKLKMF